MRRLWLMAALLVGSGAFQAAAPQSAERWGNGADALAETPP